MQKEPDVFPHECMLYQQVIYLESMVDIHFNSYIEQYTKWQELSAEIEKLKELSKIHRPLLNNELYEELNNDDVIQEFSQPSSLSYAYPLDKLCTGEHFQKTSRVSDDFQQLTKELNKKEKLIQDLVRDNKVFYKSAQENAEMIEEKILRISLLEKELQWKESVNSLWLNINHICPKIEVFWKINEIFKEQNSRLIEMLSTFCENEDNHKYLNVRKLLMDYN